jgi:hypothetical protein
MAALGLIPAWSEPRATSAIPEILTLIGSVLDSGAAYQAGGAVYFDVATFPRFGEVSHFDEPTACWPWPPNTGATPTTPASATHSTSSCGSRRSPMSPPGSRVGARVAPAGTSSARRWPSVSSGRPLTSTAAVGTWSSPTTSARRPSPSRSPARPFVRHWLHVGPGGPGRDEDVQVPGQSGLRGRPAEGVGGRGDPSRPPRPPLPDRLGVDRGRHAPCRPARLWRVATRRVGGGTPIERGRRRARAVVHSTRTSTHRVPSGPSTPRRRAGRSVVRGAALMGVTL